MSDEPDMLGNVCRRVLERLQGDGLRNWPVSMQRQAMDLAGIQPTTRKMVDVWEDWQQERTLMTREQREVKAAADRQRLANLEAAPKLALAITEDELQAIVEEIERCQRG